MNKYDLLGINVRLTNIVDKIAPWKKKKKEIND